MNNNFNQIMASQESFFITFFNKSGFVAAVPFVNGQTKQYHIYYSASKSLLEAMKTETFWYILLFFKDFSIKVSLSSSKSIKELEKLRDVVGKGKGIWLT